ncbi:MAG: hypothetical protein JSR15_11585 [Proteobacteria bacterium]|nr:hypothetical protein [Pseudomonadota bacterium]
MNRTPRPPRDERELEQYIGKLLRAQPLRQAPASLEARVQQQLALQAARPWWLQGFSAWPWLARLLFGLVGAGLVALTYLTTDRLGWVSDSLQQSTLATTGRGAAQMFANLGHALQLLGEMLTRNVSSAWLYGAAGVTVFLYVALFGLGAAAFRTLFDTTPQHARY